MESKINFNLKMATKVAFSLIWRVVVISIIPNILLGGWEKTTFSSEVLLLISLLELFISILSVVMACYWLFHSGRLGSVKIIFMESANYEKIKIE